METVAHLNVSGRSILDPRELLPPKRRPIFNRVWRVTYGVLTMIDGRKARPQTVSSRNLVSFRYIPDHAIAFEFFEERTQHVYHRGKHFIYSTGPIHRSNPTFFRAVDGSPQYLNEKGYIDMSALTDLQIAEIENIVLAFPYKPCDCGTCSVVLPIDPLTYQINRRP